MCPNCGSSKVYEVVRGTMKCDDCGHTWPVPSPARDARTEGEGHAPAQADA